MIREATIGDAEQIGVLHATSWQSAYLNLMSAAKLGPGLVDERIAIWRERLSEPSRTTWIARDGAGFISIVIDTDQGSLIDNLHVHPTRKSVGIGRTLMRCAGERLQRERPDACVYLWVLDGNFPAARFYESLDARHQFARRDAGLVGETLIEHQYRWYSPLALLAALA